MLPEVLYLAHTVLELVLGALKLRGRYHHEAAGSKPAKSQMYTRHHGFSLLSIALLGALILRAGLVNHEAGWIASVVMFAFHGGAVAAFLYTYAEGAIPFSKVLVPHAPFAVGFAMHCVSFS